MTIIDRIKSIDSSDTKELYSIFNSIKSNFAIIPFDLKAGEKIIRMRVNLPNSIFNTVDELSYPPSNKICDYGRCNIPFQSIFYASCFVDPKEGLLPRLTTLIEVSPFLRDKDSIGIQKVTYSLWTSKEKIKLIALPFSNNYERAGNKIKFIQDYWRSVENDYNLTEDSKLLSLYMSDVISKDNGQKDYFIIANYINYLLNINLKTKSFDGILYPSVKSQGEGFNIALKTNVVDTKIQFVRASLNYLIKNKMNSYLRCVKDAECDSEGRLKYFMNPRYDEEDRNIIKGMNFIN